MYYTWTYNKQNTNMCYMYIIHCFTFLLALTHRTITWIFFSTSKDESTYQRWEKGMQRTWTLKFKHGHQYLKLVRPCMAIKRWHMLNLHVHPVINHIHMQQSRFMADCSHLFCIWLSLTLEKCHHVWILTFTRWYNIMGATYPQTCLEYSYVAVQTVHHLKHFSKLI